jgi:hypothetical protein
MAGAYDKGLTEFGLGNIDVTTDEIRAYLVRSTYTPNLSTHDFLDDLSTDAVDFVALTTVTMVAGVMDADDISFPAVTGAEVDQLVIVKWVTSSADSPLLWSIDAWTSGMPITPNGGDIDITWNASGIAKL